MNYRNTPDKILTEMVYKIMRYDPDTDILKEDREAVNNTSDALYQLILTEVIGEDEVFVDIPVLDGYGKQTSIIAGESYTEYMVMRNGLRKQQRRTLAKLFNKEIS